MSRELKKKVEDLSDIEVQVIGGFSSRNYGNSKACTSFEYNKNNENNIAMLLCKNDIIWYIGMATK